MHSIDFELNFRLNLVLFQSLHRLWRNRYSRSGRPIMAKPYQDLECTSECRLKQHAEFILACVALNNLRLLQHCSSVCANYLRISDGQRRTPLLVAASMGHQRIVEWLVEKKAVPVDVRDLESGWTPLHRSLFFGHLGTAVYLVKVLHVHYTKRLGSFFGKAL